MPEPVVKTRLATLAEARKPASEGRLYAILDCCDAPVAYAKVREMDESQVFCLYRGKLNPDVLAEAPYLVRATPDLVDWIQKTVWKTPWGIFLVANTDLRSLRKHVRRFLTVADDQADAVYFRFYDPRVLSVYLPTCTDEELRVFLGPILAYGVGDPKAAAVTYFLREGPPAATVPLPQGAILRMRETQMKAFSDAAMKRFEDRTVGYLKKRFPDTYAKAGEREMRLRIQFGLKKAALYDIKEERDVRRYIHFMFMLGDELDTNPATAWARKILDMKDTTPHKRLKLLRSAAAQSHSGRHQI